LKWREQTSADDIYWTGVTYGNGLFVAVGRNAPGENGVMTSEDGVEWTMRTEAMDNSWTNVTYGGGQFVAVSSNGGLKQIMTSTDGIDWTSRSIPGGEANINWADIVYGNGRFVAVASSAYTLARTTMTSEDGITWTMILQQRRSVGTASPTAMGCLWRWHVPE